MISTFKDGDHVLELNEKAKASVYYKNTLLFIGDNRTAIQLFCKNCSNEDLRIKLNKYKYINIWD